jgi:hypothetical protein
MHSLVSANCNKIYCNWSLTKWLVCTRSWPRVDLVDVIAVLPSNIISVILYMPTLRWFLVKQKIRRYAKRRWMWFPERPSKWRVAYLVYLSLAKRLSPYPRVQIFIMGSESSLDLENLVVTSSCTSVLAPDLTWWRALGLTSWLRVESSLVLPIASTPSLPL